jgi:hypothetical protein
MMKRRYTAVIAYLITFAGCCCAQGKWNWRPESNTARSITGEVEFSSDAVSINLSQFPVARIRDLTSPEVAALFEPDGDAVGLGSLYRLSVPASKKFAHHNTLCGTEETQWAATYMTGHDLRLALFSGPAIPQLTKETLANATALCGTFSYTR